MGGNFTIKRLKADEVNLPEYLQSIGFNSNSTELGDKITTPDPISSSGADIFDRKEQGRLISARPGNKLILGLDYSMGNLTIGLNNTQFGEVTWQHGSDESKDQTFSAKLITDLNVNYQLLKASV